MRCPKCSYISYDIVETCVKCGKNISDAATDLEGSVAGVPSPSFLRIPGGEAPPEAPDETSEVSEEEPLDLGVEGEEEEMVISLDEEPSAEAEEVELDLGVEEEAEVEIDLGEEAEAEDQPEIDLGEEETEAAEAPEAEVDFGLEEEVAEEPQAEEEAAIGISDLAPSEEAEEQPDEPVAEEVEVAAEESGKGGMGLEGLDTGGLDLDTTAGGADSGKVMPSVKTGTALDDFDIDLGDLITSDEDN